MPRYEESTRLYVGHLSSRTRSRDLEHIFSRYGSYLQQSNWCLLRLDLWGPKLTVSNNHFRRVRDVDMKRDYAFIEFSDARDADDARYKLDGKDVDGRRITVEFARGVPRGPGGIREYGGGGGAPAPGSGRCFNCGIEGHWARDCKAGDLKNKCYRCGDRGHVEKNCRNSPKKPRRGRSYSRSPVRSYSPRRGRSRSRSLSRSRSYSRSSSPVRRGRDVDYEKRSRSPHHRSSKLKRRSSPSDTKKRSLTPVADNNDSPKETSRSPSVGKTVGPDENNVGYPNSSESPRRVGEDENEVVGHTRGSQSPGRGVDENDVGYPRSSESP
ncbi:hypothetical protein CASFOL_031834 [Castilleja foliolosa]|uniref:Uncharacterized protein n=1 Tax=Castilleja foliolosa TaxID=1961234 RepID=A0ABD3BZR8_9LAMI